MLPSNKIPPSSIVAIMVTAYVSNRSAAIPAQSPTLSPTLSAITAGFLGSSSGIPASILPTKSAPTSAPFVKIPPPSLAKIEINDEGLVSIAAVDGESGQAAIDWVNSIVEEPEVGKIYEGKVVKIMDFGAFVNFFGKKDGLVHISQLANERVKNVTDIVSEGDVVKVKLLGFDNRGKVKLSMKEVDQKTGKEIISESEETSEDTPKEKKPKKAKKTKKDKKEDSN